MPDGRFAECRFGCLHRRWRCCHVYRLPLVGCKFVRCTSKHSLSSVCVFGEHDYHRCRPWIRSSPYRVYFLLLRASEALLQLPLLCTVRLLRLARWLDVITPSCIVRPCLCTSTASIFESESHCRFVECRFRCFERRRRDHSRLTGCHCWSARLPPGSARRLPYHASLQRLVRNHVV